MIIDSETYKLSEKNYIMVETPKNKIILGNTNNHDMRHVIGWKNRLNSRYKKTAQFTISIDGSIYQHFEPKYHSKYFNYHDLNSKSIIILLENDGYLEKDSESGEFITWFGDIYNGNVVEKKWRGLKYWAAYTQEQFVSTIKLVENLCEDFGIMKRTFNHNTKINGLGDFSGVLYKSNLKHYYTDLNPTWDFETFKNKIENYETEN